MAESCFDIAKRLANGLLSDDEIKEALKKADDIRKRLIREGKTDNLDQRVAREITRKAQQVKFEAASRRKAVAHTVIAVNEERNLIGSHIKAGLEPWRAVFATQMGTQLPVFRGRDSIARKQQILEGRYIGAGVYAKFQRERPQILKLLRNKKFDDDVTHELYALNEGKSGITKNADAEFAAKVLAGALELSHYEGNRWGAGIAHVDNYIGPQIHDDLSARNAGMANWVSTISDLLDKEKNFPDASAAEIKQELESLYKTITTGVAERPEYLLGKRISPTKLATTKLEYLYFKDAASAITYRDTFGRGSTTSAIIDHLRAAARRNASMELWGKDAKRNVNGVVAELIDELRHAQSGEPNKQNRIMRNLKPIGDQKLQHELESLQGAKLQSAIDVATGLTKTPPVGAEKWANLHASIRGGFLLGSLGRVLLTAVNDFGTVADAAMMRGQGFWNGFFAEMNEIKGSMTDPEWKEFAYSYGEAHDGMTGHLASPAATLDGPPGQTAKFVEQFLRLTGITKYTDTGRGAVSRMIVAHLGYNRQKAFNELHPRLQRTLGRNGIDEAQWKALQPLFYKEDNGRWYITPDLVGDLTDDQVKGIGGSPEDARRLLEHNLRGYVSDEVSQSIIEADPQTQRITTGGYRPGTMSGEAARYFFQFKGWPIGFAQRVLGRHIAEFGVSGESTAERVLRTTFGLAPLIAGMTMSGYAAMVMADAADGIWPPRDPFKTKTWLTAMARGGGFGMYGDYLFGQAAGFGQSALIQSGGPALTTLSDITNLGLQIRDDLINKDELSAGTKMKALNLALTHTPYVNLFYIRPVWEMLIANSLKEAVSPGYLQRQNAQRRRNYGQTYQFPRTLGELLK